LPVLVNVSNRPRPCKSGPFRCCHRSCQIRPVMATVTSAGGWRARLPPVRTSGRSVTNLGRSETIGSQRLSPAITRRADFLLIARDHTRQPGIYGDCIVEGSCRFTCRSLTTARLSPKKNTAIPVTPIGVSGLTRTFGPTRKETTPVRRPTPQKSCQTAIATMSCSAPRPRISRLAPRGNCPVTNVRQPPQRLNTAPTDRIVKTTPLVICCSSMACRLGPPPMAVNAERLPLGQLPHVPLTG
jgi:hypothetical protein